MPSVSCLFHLSGEDIKTENFTLSLPINKCPRLDAICPYFTRFPLSFPWQHLIYAEVGQQLLDPFCGCGTSLLAARLRGLCGTGIECNPVAAAIARAKISTASPSAVIARAAVLLASDDSVELPEGAFWKHCFSPGVLDALCRLRTHFQGTLTTQTDLVLCAILLGLLHGPSDRRLFFSNVMPASYAPSQETLLLFWTDNHMRPPDADVLEIIERRAKYILCETMDTPPARVICGDCRAKEPYANLDTIDHIITSPPYFGLNSFIQDQWLRMWFLGNPKVSEYLITQTSVEAYIKELAQVWRNCASVCRPGASLCVRFGEVPGFNSIHPRAILETSLALADSGWKIKRFKPVVEKHNGTDYTIPCPPPASRPRHEFVLHSRLET